MNYRIWFDGKAEVVRVKIHGKFGSEDNRAFLQELEDAFRDRQHRIAVIDVTKGQFSLPKRENRGQMVERIKNIDFERLAFVGASPLIKMMMKIIAISLGRKGSIGSFDKDDEALIWIQSQQAFNNIER